MVAVNSARTTYRRMKNQAFASRRAPAGEARPAHHQRHRRHPPRPARGDGDDRAGPPAVRRAADPARRLRHVLRGHRPAGRRPARARSRPRSTTAASSRGRCCAGRTEMRRLAPGAGRRWSLLALVASGCGAVAPPTPAAAARRRRRDGRTETGTTAYDAAREQPARGHRLPRRSATPAWTPCTTTSTSAGTPAPHAAHRRRRRCCSARPRDADHLQLDLARQLQVGRRLARRQGGRRSGTTARTSWSTAPVTRRRPHVAAADLRRHARAGAGADRPRRLRHHGLDHHRRRQRLDDAGAVRRLLLVRRQRPAVRQGASTTSRSAPAPMVGVANGRLTRPRTVGTAHRHPLAPGRAGVVVPRHDRDRRPSRETHDTGPHGLPVTYWTPTRAARRCGALRYTPEAIALARGQGRAATRSRPLGVLVVAVAAARWRPRR